MRTYPRVNDIWHETLTEIRDRTPADTIVNAWWDYGYFIKYYAERRVSADGASLLSRVPQRIGQALLASTDREAVGWLRMLNCGSDASSEPEGERGAYARLVAAGLTPTEAEAMLPQLVRANRDGAEKILLGKRLGRRSRLPVLEATHCTPPDSVLLLSSEMIRMPAWWYLGGWDTTHAWIEQQVSGLDRPAAVARLRELAYGETEAEAILDQIERGQFGRDASKFVANASPYLVGHWIACQADASGRRRCPMGQVSGGNKVVLDSFTYDPQAPEEGVFLIGSPAGGQLYRARPSAVLVAGPTSLERRDSESHQAGPLLVDTVQHRILVGPLYLLESTFTRLVFLEGRYSGEHFTSFSDRVGAAERLFAYRIGWDSDPESAR